MNKTKLNLIIDIILLIAMAGIAGIGFLVKYIMPCGHAVKHSGAQVYASNLWGMDRHGWGDIHWYLGIIFLVLLLAHIILHWKMISAMFKQLIPNEGLRTVVAVVLVLIVIVCLIGPFLFML